MSKRFNREDVDRFYDYDIYVPTRTLYIGTRTVDDDNNEEGVDAALSEFIIKGLLILDSKSNEDITIIINNVGGEVFHGFAIYDAIRACKSKVIMKVFGQCMSIAALILQAADIRMVSPLSRIMIHVGTFGLADNHPEIQKAWVKQFAKDDEEYVRILLEKIQQKHPDYTRARLENKILFDKILDAQESIELGLSDSII